MKRFIEFAMKEEGFDVKHLNVGVVVLKIELFWKDVRNRFLINPVEVKNS